MKLLNSSVDRDCHCLEGLFMFGFVLFSWPIYLILHCLFPAAFKFSLKWLTQMANKSLKPSLCVNPISYEWR